MVQQVAGARVHGVALAPALADLKAMAAGQLHHAVVAAAVAQGLPQRGVALAQGHKGVELAHFLQKLLQLGFSHGQGSVA